MANENDGERYEDPEAETVFDGFFKLEKHRIPGMGFPVMIVRATDSAAVLLFDSRKRRVLLVKQPRVAMCRDDNPSGEIIELVAGRFDVNLGPKALVVKEAREEVGVELDEDDVVVLNGGAPLALSAGVLTERCYLLAADIAKGRIIEPDDGKVFGVPEEGERIQRIWVDMDEFISPDFRHECLRTWAMAQHVRAELHQKRILRSEFE